MHSDLTRWVKDVIGRFSFQQKLLAWDSYEAHLTDNVKRFLVQALVAEEKRCIQFGENKNEITYFISHRSNDIKYFTSVSSCFLKSSNNEHSSENKMLNESIFSLSTHSFTIVNHFIFCTSSATDISMDTS